MNPYNPLDDLYKNILAPLSDAFREVEELGSLKSTLNNIQEQYNRFISANDALNSALTKEKRLRSTIISLEKRIENSAPDSSPPAPYSRLAEAQNQLILVDTQLQELDVEIKEQGLNGVRSQTQVKLLKRKRIVLQRIASFQEPYYTLRRQLEATKRELDRFLSESNQELLRRASESSRRIIKEIPADLKARLETAKDSVNRILNDSLSRGYDWNSVCTRYPSQYWNGYPRAFGVVEHVIQVKGLSSLSPSRENIAEIATFLEGLIPSDLERILVRLPNAIHYVPGLTSHNERVVALLRYISSRSGPGMRRLMELLEEMFPQSFKAS